MYPNVHSSIIYNCQDVEATQVPINRWMDKKYMVCIYTMEYYSSVKSNEILPFSSMWMDLENIILSEKCHTEKDKYCVCFHLYVESKKNKAYECIQKNRIRLTENKLCFNILYLFFSFWLTSLCITGSWLIHLTRIDSSSFLFLVE